jgi:hypothetical protein
MPRLLQNPADLKLPMAPRILPCASCGNSMLASAASVVDKDTGKPLCLSCGVDQIVRELRSS